MSVAVVDAERHSPIPEADDAGDLDHGRPYVRGRRSRARAATIAAQPPMPAAAAVKPNTGTT
jgi:hypothetical protein